MKRELRVCAITLALAGAAASAAERSESTERAPLWELGFGLAALQVPDYRGADERSGFVLPLPYVVYRGEFLRADRSGARAVLVDVERVEVDLSVSGSVPTRSRDNAARTGMPDLAPTVELGPNVNVLLWRAEDRRAKLDLRLPLRAVLTIERSPDMAGAVFTPNLNLDVRAGAWNLGLLTGPLFGDRRHHQRLYGVDPAFATPTRPAYTARRGYGGWQALVAASRRFDRFWFGAFVRYDNLAGARFDDSPLVRRRHALGAGFGVVWVFATSSEWVTLPD
jgi:outer membrane scaffolding protein for murein synthesis (MipA/OmpV family)